MRTQELIKDYVETCSLSANTLMQYQLILKRFFAFYKKEYDQITRHDIDDWLQEQHEIGYGLQYIKSMSCAIHSFFRFCRLQGYLKEDLTLKLKPEKQYWILENENIDDDNLKIINAYLQFQKPYKSPSYINQKRRLLRRLFTHINKPLNRISKVDTLDWILKNSVKENGEVKESSTISGYISELNCFFGYCFKKKLIEQIPMKKIWRPKVPKRLSKALDTRDYSQVKLALEEFPLRDQAIFWFLASSGCRVEEVTGLDVRDINLESRSAIVLGKGCKTRKVHFSKFAAILLEKYIEIHPVGEPALFINSRGHRMTTENIRLIAEELGKKAGLNKKLTPHVFRHTFATGRNFKGAELGFIRQELGHKHLETTEGYVKTLTEEIKQAYNKIMG